MFVFVSGAARNDKSAWAEEYALSLSRADASRGGAPLIYLATVRADDQEMRERVLRHQAARLGKGFATLERDADVSKCAPALAPRST